MPTKTTLVMLAAAGAMTATAPLSAPSASHGPPAPLSISPSHDTGQPDQSCEDLENQPGQSMDARGGAFNPDGTSGSVYAGEQDGTNNKNTASVSQYDQACAVNQSGQPQ